MSKTIVNDKYQDLQITDIDKIKDIIAHPYKLNYVKLDNLKKICSDLNLSIYKNNSKIFKNKKQLFNEIISHI